jgi:uncharacterized protein (UPF0332 family)
MDPLKFLDLASDWATGSREGEWRSSVSRSYYAVFHVARNLLRQVGFQVPRGDQCHSYVYARLNNTADQTIERAASQLHDLRRARNQADYDLDIPVTEQDAVNAVNLAMNINGTLAALAANPAILAQVTQAMRDYERTTLGVVTWRNP